jgi:signal transduction histidine kinase
MSRQDGRDGRIRELVSRIAEAEEELQALAAGELDAVFAPGAAGPLLLRGAQEALRSQAAIVRLLQAVSAAANESTTLETAARIALEEVCRYTGWSAGHLYRLSGEGSLEHAGVWHEEAAPRYERFHRALRERPSNARAGLAGQVLRTGRPAWRLEPETESADAAERTAVRLGLRAAYAFPILAGAQVVGVLEFFTEVGGEPDAALLEAMDHVGLQLGRVVERARAEAAAIRLTREQAARAAAEEVGRRNAFLAQASELLHSSLDYESTLRSLARLIVPELADWCFVDLAEEGDRYRRLAAAHADPAGERLSPAFERTYGSRDDPHLGVSRVVRTDRPEFAGTATPETLQWLTRDPEHLRLLAELNVVSHLSVPLTARGRTLGALSVLSVTPGRRFGEEDLPFAEDLARRAAVAVDNARLYREVQEANQSKANFLAVMSHELRTPLNAVLGYSDLLSLGIPAEIPDEARDQVNRIAMSARHLLELIDGILTHARLESGREEVRVEEVSVGDLVAGVTALIEPLAQDRGLRFRAALQGRRAVARTDAAKVRQILLNLLSNAIKYTDEGEVRLRVAVEAEHLHLEVSDTGIGIPLDQQGRVFEPFWQLEQSNTRRAEGTGLGLAIVRDLVRLLGGEIHLRSAPGEGTTFRVRLPLSV